MLVAGETYIAVCDVDLLQLSHPMYLFPDPAQPNSLDLSYVAAQSPQAAGRLRLLDAYMLFGHLSMGGLLVKIRKT